MTAQDNIKLKTAGIWLATGAALLALALVFHGPPDPDLGVQMSHISEGHLRWSVVHWGAAISLSLFAATGLAVLASGSPLTASGWTLTAWAVLTLGALWTMTTAVIEATAISDAAKAGNLEIFTAFWAVSEGKGNGFAALALAILVIAGNQFRVPTSGLPAWAALAGAAFGALSFSGWVLGSWLGIGIGGPVWLLSSLAMCLWMIWFGMSLGRTASVAAKMDSHLYAKAPQAGAVARADTE